MPEVIKNPDGTYNVPAVEFNIPLKYAAPFQTSLILNEEEIRALASILEKQYIDYHNEKAHEVVNRIFKTIHDMDIRANGSNK